MRETISDASYNIENPLGESTDVFSDVDYESFAPNEGGIVDVDQVRELIGNAYGEYTDDPEYADDRYGFDRMNEEKYGDVYNQGMKFGDADTFQEYFASNPQLYEGMQENLGRGIDKTMDTAGGIWDYAKQKGLGLQHGLGLVNENYLMPAFAGIMSMANKVNPLSPRSTNYNPALQGQVDYLKEAGGLRDPSNPYKITGGPLAGQNLVSGFGTNDYGQMLDKRINYFRKQQAKKGKLTIEQNRRMHEAIAEKERVDAAAAAKKTQQAQQAQQHPGGGGRTEGNVGGWSATPTSSGSGQGGGYGTGTGYTDKSSVSSGGWKW